MQNTIYATIESSVKSVRLLTDLLLALGFRRTNTVFEKYYLCIFCVLFVIKQQNNGYLKREGRLINNKYKNNLICSSLTSGNNSKLNKFCDI